jgi:hypothetical protein
MELASRESDVIRFDNRDTGLSFRIGSLTVNELMEKVGALFMGQETSVPYELGDMADDLQSAKVKDSDFSVIGEMYCDFY